MSCEDSGHQIASGRVHTDFRWSPIECGLVLCLCRPLAAKYCILRRLCAPRRRAAAAQSLAHATATRKQLDLELTR
eukprot:4913830-Prymnesium_polylepis.1